MKPTVMEIIALSEKIEAAGLGQVDLVRAALARWGRPAPLEQMQQDDRSAAHPLAIEARAALAQTPPQGEGPTDEDLVRLAKEWVCVELGSGCEGIELEFVPDFARAVLARWGCPASGHVPAVAGELKGLVISLRHCADALRVYGLTGSANTCVCAADLLERLNPPQPVPVTERLPGPEDCDTEGMCWWYGEGEDMVGWTHQDLEGLSYYRSTHWLPAHALPLP